MAEDDVRIERPNRKKASSKASRAVVILLLLVSAALVLIVTIGGWDALQGAQAIQIAYIGVYLVMAFYVARWNRGVLPVAAALAIILLIFAAVAGPGVVRARQDRLHGSGARRGPARAHHAAHRPGPGAAHRLRDAGFSQEWNVEVERRSDSPSGPAPAAG